MTLHLQCPSDKVFGSEGRGDRTKAENFTRPTKGRMPGRLERLEMLVLRSQKGGREQWVRVW